MSIELSSRLSRARAILQPLAQGIVLVLALVLCVATVLAILQVIPWPQLALFYGAKAVPNAGMWAQIGLTAMALVLLFYLPANLRMARLERSHRSFAVGMEDVARAYRYAHAQDRAGVFGLSSEFEAMKARMEHMRAHPDLQMLEPEILQLAAQMSLQTRDLAKAYSDSKVERARGFLRQRQEEVAALSERIAIARASCDELRRWLVDVETEERQAQAQIKRLEADLAEILPALGYVFEQPDPREDNVVALPKAAKQVLDPA